MQTLIVMAGSSERFKAVGYEGCKGLLPLADGRPIIQHICERLPQGSVTALIRPEHRGDIAGFVPGVKLVAVEPTEGPVGTVQAALAHIRRGHLLVVYCDVLLPFAKFVSAMEAMNVPQGIVLFPSADTRFGHWSSLGTIVHSSRYVSPWAVSGAYYFQDARLFSYRVAQAPAAAGISDLIEPGAGTYTMDVLDIGTPEDYERHLRTGWLP